MVWAFWVGRVPAYAMKSVQDPSRRIVSRALLFGHDDPVHVSELRRIQSDSPT